MKFFESLIMGLITGFTEFLPISSDAHQQILGTLFGVNYNDPIRKLLVHIAIFLAVFMATARKRRYQALAYENQIRKRRNQRISHATMEYRLVRLALIPFLTTYFLLYFIFPFKENLLITSVCLLINGIVIYLPSRMLQGNKNANVMSSLEIILIGIAAGLSAITGISRIGWMVSVAAFCSADRKASTGWALLLSVSACAAQICVDIFEIFAGNGAAFWSNIIFYLLAAVLAYFGAQAGMHILTKHMSKNGCSNYAYYCWGAALLALILYLTIA